MIKHVWALIKKDFTENNLTYTQLMKKYEIKSRATIASHSKKEGWIGERERLRKGIVLETIRRDEEMKEDRLNEKEKLIKAIEELIGLKIGAEKKALFKTVNTEDLKLILSVIKSVKTPLPELIKVLELLKGGLTERIGGSEAEDKARKRLNELLGTEPIKWGSEN